MKLTAYIRCIPGVDSGITVLSRLSMAALTSISAKPTTANHETTTSRSSSFSSDQDTLRYSTDDPPLVTLTMHTPTISSPTGVSRTISPKAITMSLSFWALDVLDRIYLRLPSKFAQLLEAKARTSSLQPIFTQDTKTTGNSSLKDSSFGKQSRFSEAFNRLTCIFTPQKLLIKSVHSIATIGKSSFGGVFNKLTSNLTQKLPIITLDSIGSIAKAFGKLTNIFKTQKLPTKDNINNSLLNQCTAKTVQSLSSVLVTGLKTVDYLLMTSYSQIPFIHSTQQLNISTNKKNVNGTSSTNQQSGNESVSNNQQSVNDSISNNQQSVNESISNNQQSVNELLSTDKTYVNEISSTREQPVQNCPTEDFKFKPSAAIGIRDKLFNFFLGSVISIKKISEILKKNRVAADHESIFHHFHLYKDGTCFEPLSFAFAAADWSVMYDIGAAKYIQQNLNESLLKSAVFVGSSNGSLVASYLATNTDVDLLREQVVNVARLNSNNLTGALYLSEPLAQALQVVDYKDALMGKLQIHSTTIPSMQPNIFTNYTCKNDIVEAVRSSCYIPFVYQTPSLMQNVFHAAGTLVNWMPTLNTRTITCSFNSKMANISPDTDCRITRAQRVFASDETVLDTMYSEGYRDAERWFGLVIDTKVLPRLVLKA